ncbi:hypothetical protein Tco_1209546 [Tanacetum coccineum]
MQEPPPPDFVSEPLYPEFMPPKDDVMPAEEQPLPATVSPTTDSPGYIDESDPNEDPEEDDEDPKEDPTEYPTDRDDDDDEEEESSKDETDDEEEDEDEDEEEEEHPAPAEYILPPHHAYRVMARLLALPTPPLSWLTPYPSPIPQIPSPPLPVSPRLPISPPPLPTSPTHPLGYRAAMIWLRAETPSTSHPLPLPPLTSSPPLLLPSTNHRADFPEVCLPPRKRLCIALGLRYEVGESSSAPTPRPTGGFRADYGFVSTMDREIRRDLDKEIGYEITDIWEDPAKVAEEVHATDAAELSQRMTDFVTTVRQDTDEIYGRLDDAHSDRSLMTGQLNVLRRDRRYHANTALLIMREARASREA